MTIDYADGAESAVLAVLRAATDVSAGSAELAAKVASWEEIYHFAPARLGLLAPLRLRPGLRALDIGCGSGVFARLLGEAGVEVLGLEGAPARADAARARCRDLPNVRIVTGSVADGLPDDAEPADLALLCGVLEYSAQYADGPQAMLRSVAGALAENGVLVLAIENQLGLKYLLGGTEDHHGSAWIGLAGYPGAKPQPKTWTRRSLAALLDEVGLGAQRWLLPYPDYKLPRVVLDEALFARDDAAELVDKFVRDPLQGGFGGNDAAVPGRLVHELAVADGLGAAIAPSFLVLAARSPNALAQLADPGLAWLISGTRRSEWRRVRRLDENSTLHTVHFGPGMAGAWLRQQHNDTEPVRPGRALDAYLLDAMRAGDLVELRRLLRRWRVICLEHARPLDADLVRHPFLPHRAGIPVLPADHLDVHPGNLIVGPDGEISRVDLEWLGGDGVDAELVMVRALVEFTRESVHNRAPHPWPALATARDLAAELCALADLGDALATRWSELVTAEAALQELVTGRPAARVRKEIEEDATAVVAEPLWEVPGGLRTLRAERSARDQLVAERERELADVSARLVERAREQAEAADWFAERERQLTDEVARQHTQLDDFTDRLVQAEHQLAGSRAELDVKDDRIALAFAELADALAEAQTASANSANSTAAAELPVLRDRLARTRGRLDALEQSRLVRLGNRVLWPAGRLSRGLRDLALARPGDEPDGVLRAIGRRIPAISARLATRYRRAAAPGRESGLYYGLPVPADPIAVGAGQVVELTGWVTHASIDVRQVRLTVGDRVVVASRGHHQPDVASALRSGGIRAPEGTGIHVRIPVLPQDAPGELPLSLSVDLADGTRLRRTLPALRLIPAVDLAPVPVRWPGTGPRVVICLASYQPNVDFLAGQLDSLRAQTHANWVCVISDDGSDEKSLAAIHALTADDDRFTVVHHDSNAGFYRNFERALALAPADADLVALCDQDDVWDPDKLSTLLGRMVDPAVSLAYADMRLTDKNDDIIDSTFWRHRQNQWHDLDSLLLFNTITGAASMVRAEVIRAHALPFPPGTPSAFHDHWIATVAMAAGRIEFVDRPLHSYRQHADAVTGRRDGRLDRGLPTGVGWLRLGLGSSRVLAPEKAAELEAVVEFELRRVAQFATVLLLRMGDRLAPGTRARLSELAGAEDDLRPLLIRAVRASRKGGQETAGAERFLLAAALRWRALRGSRLRMPALSQTPLD